MKIALLQPELSEKYQNQEQAYGVGIRPPETGLAVLTGWIKNYSRIPSEINIIDPRKGSNEIAEEVSSYDLLGMSDWFSNHGKVIEISQKAKKINPLLKIVLGGPNASLVAKEIMNKYNFIDYIVSRDGEEALLGVAEEKKINEVPNLFYRKNEREINFTFPHLTSLKKMPLWDFSNFQNVNERIKDYLRFQKEGKDPWLVPPLTLFNFRGCSKAMKEGICNYCTSSETKGRILPAEKFWEQVSHLNYKYGAEIFYMADDIFTVNAKIIHNLSKTKPSFAKTKIRAYGYLPYLSKLSQSKLEEVAENLGNIGVFNLFYGSETYDPFVLKNVNKRGVSVNETIRVIKTLKDKGKIKTTMAYLLGLPGESRESLQTNMDSFKRLLDTDDCLERLYISIGMPLKGSLWCSELQLNSNIRGDYQKESKKDLVNDDDPEYDLLSRLAIKYQTSVTPKQINENIQKMIELAKTKIPPHKVGGFMLKN